MKKRVALASYLVLWAALAGGVIYGIIAAGYSPWIAVGSAFLLFFILNGSLAYRAGVHRLRLEGKEPPPYLRYLFFPRGFPKYREAAPRFTHLLVDIAAALTGMFFIFCGVAVAFDADWSRIPNPMLPASICMVLAGIGALFLYLAWRLVAFGTKAADRCRLTTRPTRTRAQAPCFA
jgi:hypothetical protein